MKLQSSVWVFQWRGLSRKPPSCLFNFFTPKVLRKLLLCVRVVPSTGEEANRQDKPNLHHLGTAAQGPLSFHQGIWCWQTQMAGALCLLSNRTQDLCPSHCFFFCEKHSSASLHEWRSWSEIFPFECTPSKTCQHTLSILPFSPGAPVTPQAWLGGLHHWGQGGLCCGTYCCRSTLKEASPLRLKESLQGQLVLLPTYHGPQSSLGISGPFRLPKPKKTHTHLST